MHSTARHITRRIALIVVLGTGLCRWPASVALAQVDPLPSWNEGTVKKSFTDFVARVTTQGSPDFVAVE
jgi:hypothetical protein